LIVTGIELNNFRNYAHQELEFSPENNVVFGRNAQGKSNLLEAVYFLSHLRSNRAPRMRDLVLEGQERASVRGSIIDGEAKLNIHVSFSRQGKRAEVNGQKAESASRVKGLLKCVMFAPDDLYIIKGDPARRREFLDETLEGMGPLAARRILQYKHVLRQRNAVLRSWRVSGSAAASAIEPWDDALAKAGASVVAARAGMVPLMQENIEEAYRTIAGEESVVRVRYAGTFEVSSLDEAAIEMQMRRALEMSQEEERRAGTTVVGPHRDDVEISLGGREARFSASQGEQRTLAFCLRVAQGRYLEQETGRKPVTLLDDVLSELDRERRARVLELAGAGGQAILTTTDAPEDLDGVKGKVFRVQQGKVTGV
jgi:DNA replication and repair protein RecF